MCKDSVTVRLQVVILRLAQSKNGMMSIVSEENSMYNRSVAQVATVRTLLEVLATGENTRR